MATASPPRPAPATRAHGLVLPAVTAVGVAVLLFVVFGPSYVNYDAQYALLWARDAWWGDTPEYTAAFAPTPHPLATAVSSLALPLGNDADLAILWLILLCFGALVWLSYRLGAELFHPAVGVVAALVVLTRPALARDTLLAYQDIPFALLVVGAVLLEARRPKRGAAVLALLALAGLLRPEAWVLSGLYWLYCGPRVRTAAIVVSAPLIWAGTDWLVTGDLLHSLHGTADLAIENDRRRTPGEVPFWTAEYFGYVLREPLVIGVPLGLLFAWWHARRPAALPLATVAAMTAVFVVGPFFGLPLIRRYVDTPAVLLSLFYGLAVTGWLLLPAASRSRRRWQAAGLLALALSVVYLPWHVRELRAVERRPDATAPMYADLQRLAETPAVAAAFSRCAPLSAADHRPMPFIRFWLGGTPGSVTTVEGGADPLGELLLVPRRGPTTRRIYPPGVFPDVTAPAGWEPIHRNRSWRLYAAPGCVTRPPS